MINDTKNLYRDFLPIELKDVEQSLGALANTFINFNEPAPFTRSILNQVMPFVKLDEPGITYFTVFSANLGIRKIADATKHVDTLFEETYSVSRSLFAVNATLLETPGDEFARAFG
ncbi:hypothetical protein BGX31_001601, partial [Mortierella sp. GBA43]